MNLEINSNVQVKTIADKAEVVIFTVENESFRIASEILMLSEAFQLEGLQYPAGVFVDKLLKKVDYYSRHKQCLIKIFRSLPDETEIREYLALSSKTDFLFLIDNDSARCGHCVDCNEYGICPLVAKAAEMFGACILSDDQIYEFIEADEVWETKR